MQLLTIGASGAQVKMHWVHQTYWQPGPQGNDIHKTNVPNLRMRFRYDNLQACRRPLAMYHASTAVACICAAAA